MLARSSDAETRLAPLTPQPNIEMRQDACTALGHVPNTQRLGAAGRDAILRCLDDPNEAVRSAAAFAAGRRGVREAEPKLLTRMAGVPERNVIEALALLGSSNALPLIRAHAKSSGPQQSRAIRALTRFSLDPETEETLIDVLSRDPDPYTMKQAGEALIELGSVRALPALQQFVQKFARRLAKRSRKEVFRTFPAVIERLLKTGVPL